jgi:hypothetical protein
VITSSRNRKPAKTKDEPDDITASVPGLQRSANATQPPAAPPHSGRQAVPQVPADREPRSPHAETGSQQAQKRSAQTPPLQSSARWDQPTQHCYVFGYGAGNDEGQRADLGAPLGQWFRNPGARPATHPRFHKQSRLAERGLSRPERSIRRCGAATVWPTAKLMMVSSSLSQPPWQLSLHASKSAPSRRQVHANRTPVSSACIRQSRRCLLWI